MASKSVGSSASQRRGRHCSSAIKISSPPGTDRDNDDAHAELARIHECDTGRGRADGLDHFPHHPVAAIGSELHPKRVASKSAGTAYLRLRFGSFHTVSAYGMIHSQILLVVAVAFPA
jgi:hypothetical protein